MRKTKFLKLKMREASFISRALLSTRHPVLAHLIPMRRCNLACGYCNEYDHTSKPIDRLIDRVMAVCADERIPCLDLREPLLEVAGQDGWWANRLDSHPGPLTNAVAARAVASFFGEQWRVDASAAPHPPPVASQR